jgi:hypothetical protein
MQLAQFVSFFDGHVAGASVKSPPFDHPQGVAYDAARDSLVIVDEGNHRVQAWQLPAWSMLWQVRVC